MWQAPTFAFSTKRCRVNKTNVAKLYLTVNQQHAKKVVSDSPGLVDFAIGLVNSVVRLPDRQVRFFEQFE